MNLRLVALLFVASLVADAWAQAPGVPVQNNWLSVHDPGLIGKARALKDAGRLTLTDQNTPPALLAPTPARVHILPPSAVDLPGRRIAEIGRAALVRVGWFNRCTACDEWHATLAGGFAIASNGVVATAYHCLDPAQQSMREGYLVAFDYGGQAYPVTAVLAADPRRDVAVVRIDAQNLRAIPLSEQAAPGDAAHVHSDPLGVEGYFSAGIVNRFFRGGGDPPPTPSAPALIRMHVSTDWGPGSSGAAVLDARGNAIGMVSLINPLGYEDDGGKAPVSTAGEAADEGDPEAEHEHTILVLHEAVPAGEILRVLESMQKLAAP